MTTPAQAPSRRVEMLVERIIEWLVLGRYDELKQHVEFAGYMSSMATTNMPDKLITASWSLMTHSEQNQVVDQLLSFGWHASSKRISFSDGVEYHNLIVGI